jgi:hypothetical protein
MCALLRLSVELERVAWGAVPGGERATPQHGTTCAAGCAPCAVVYRGFVSASRPAGTAASAIEQCSRMLSTCAPHPMGSLRRAERDDSLT